MRYFVLFLVLVVIAIGGSFGLYYYNNLNKSSANPLSATSQGTARLAGWESYKFEAYGFEIQLPEDWQQIESLDGTSTLVFTPKSAEYFTRPDNQHLRIVIHAQENPNELSYKKLNKLNELELENYNKGDDTTIGGRPTKVIYGHIFPELNLKTDPIAIVQLDNKFMFIVWPKENDDYDMFRTFLSTIIFFEPYGLTNSSQPVKKEPITDRGAWCSKSPMPGRCYAEIAQTEKNPLASWCESIKPDNSGDVGDLKSWYYFYNNLCYTNIAPKLKDIALCDRMVGEEQFEINKIRDTRDCKSWVNYELALQSKDINYCEKVDLNTHIDGGYGKTVSYVNCYVMVAAEVNDQYICDKIDLPQSKTGSDENKKWCHYNYAVEKKDCSLLPLSLSALKSQCEPFVKNGI